MVVTSDLDRIIVEARELLGRELPRLIEEMMKIARTEKYRVDVRLKALQYLVSQTLGQPPARAEITGAGGRPIEVVAWMPSQEYVRAREQKLVGEAKAALELGSPGRSGLPEGAVDAGNDTL